MPELKKVDPIESTDPPVEQASTKSVAMIEAMISDEAMDSVRNVTDRAFNFVPPDQRSHLEEVLVMYTALKRAQKLLETQAKNMLGTLINASGIDVDALEAGFNDVVVDAPTKALELKVTNGGTRFDKTKACNFLARAGIAQGYIDKMMEEATIENKPRKIFSVTNK